MQYITVNDAHKKYGLNRQTVYNKIDAGAPHKRCDCGKVLIPDDEDTISKFYKTYGCTGV